MDETCFLDRDSGDFRDEGMKISSFGGLIIRDESIKSSEWNIVPLTAFYMTVLLEE